MIATLIRFLSTLTFALGMNHAASDPVDYFGSISVGMTRAEIVERIGEPDRGASASDIEYMVYYLPGHGRIVDPGCRSTQDSGIAVFASECLRDMNILVVRLDSGVAVVANQAYDDIDLELSLEVAIRLRNESLDH